MRENKRGGLAAGSELGGVPNLKKIGVRSRPPQKKERKKGRGMVFISKKRLLVFGTMGRKEGCLPELGGGTSSSHRSSWREKKRPGSFLRDREGSRAGRKERDGYGWRTAASERGKGRKKKVALFLPRKNNRYFNQISNMISSLSSRLTLQRRG